MNATEPNAHLVRTDLQAFRCALGVFCFRNES